MEAHGHMTVAYSTPRDHMTEAEVPEKLPEKVAQKGPWKVPMS